MAEWPSDLPQAPLLAGYQEQPPAVALRTQMDAGPAKVRRRFTAGIRPFRLRFIFTADELALFDEFFRDTVSGGVMPFDWVHPRTGDSATFRFVTPPPPTYVPLGPDVWQVEAQFELMP